MNARTRSPLRDPDLVGMLASKPELLAIADALVQTRPAPARRRPVVAASLAGVLAAAAAVLLVVSPWQGSGSLVEKALAAVGDHDVLHVVIEQPQNPGESLIDIASGRAIPRDARTEIWFDGTRDLKKTVSTIDGKVLDEMLETAEGGWSHGGRIYTCAWIAAHPVEATKAGVSCNASGENGTTPRIIPERPPTLEQALAGFLDGYRSALASGQAAQIGTGTVGGREVIWLRIDVPRVVDPPPGAPVPPPASEEVAVDVETHKPLLVRRADGSVSFRVLSIDTIPYEARLFARPRPVEGQGGGNVSPGTPVTLDQAAAILGGKLLWLGHEWRGLRLVETTHHRPTLTFWLGSQRRIERADLIRLTYAPVASDGTVVDRFSLTIYEAIRCVSNAGMACSPLSPGAGQMLVRLPGATLRLEGLHLALWTSHRLQREPVPLDVARALHPRD